MERIRPWKTDTELDAEMRQRPGGFGGFGPGGVLVGRTQPAKPWATYGLLIAFVAVYILELLVFNLAGFETFRQIFTIYILDPTEWLQRFWSPFTSTASHSPTRPMHLLFNGLALYFFGPHIEFRFGRAHFLTFFFATGAVSGIIQALIASPVPALGASGGIMGLIGLTIVLQPQTRIFMFPLPTPIPLWVAGLIFALLDLAGALSGASGIGNFAHLAGLGLGLAWGYYLKAGRTRRPTILAR